MQRHHIGRAKTSLHIDERNPFHLVTFRMSVYRLDLHSQGKCDGRYGATDPAQSDDTHSQSVQFYQRFVPVAEIRLRGPLSLPPTFGVKADIRRQLKRSANVCCATACVPYAGTLVTTIFCSRAASTSTILKPVAVTPI